MSYKIKTHVKNIQIHGKKQYQEFEKPVFNLAQQIIYSEVVYGLKSYTENQLAKLPEVRKQAINQRFNRAQRFLNGWKQEIINKKVDDFLVSLFPKSKIIKHMISVKGHDDTIKQPQSFKSLGISKQNVAEKLVQNRLLPKDFFQIH